MKKPLLYLLILVVAVLGSSCSQSSEGTFEVGKNTFLLNGKTVCCKKRQRFIIRVSRKNIGNIVLKCARHWV